MNKYTKIRLAGYTAATILSGSIFTAGYIGNLIGDKIDDNSLNQLESKTKIVNISDNDNESLYTLLYFENGEYKQYPNSPIFTNYDKANTYKENLLNNINNKEDENFVKLYIEVFTLGAFSTIVGFTEYSIKQEKEKEKKKLKK